MSNVLDLSSGTGILTYASSYRIHQKFFFYFFFYIFIDMPIIQFCCMPFGNSFIVSDRHIYIYIYITNGPIYTYLNRWCPVDEYFIRMVTIFKTSIWLNFI